MNPLTLKNFPSQINVAEMLKVFAAFEHAKTLRSTTWPVVLEDFKIAFISASGDRAFYTPRLNILEVFGLRKRELLHSRTLAWFLTEDASHEQGSLFTDCLLQKCSVIIPNCSGYLVQQESPDRVDVVAYKRATFAVFIENKVEHHEREQQFADLQGSLAKFGRSNQIPAPCQVPVFLTDDGRLPTTAQPGTIPGSSSGNVRPIRRLELFQAFREALATQPAASEVLKIFLDAYIESIASHSGTPL